MSSIENYVVAFVVLGAVVMLIAKVIRTYKDGGCCSCCKGVDCECCMRKRKENDSNEQRQD